MLVVGGSAFAISGSLPPSAGLRSEVVSFPFEASLVLVLERTEASAISGLLPLSAVLGGEVVGFPFEASLMLVLGFAERSEAASAIRDLLPLSAWLRGEVVGFPFEPLLMLVVGFAVRTGAAFAISGLLQLRLALNLRVDRRLDFVLLAFLDMGFSGRGFVVKSCPHKEGPRCGGAPLCLSSSRQGGKTALMLGRVNLFGGCVQRRLVGEQHGVRKVPS